MPKFRINKLVKRRLRSRRSVRIRKANSSTSGHTGRQKMAVHRRLVLYPDTADSSWLSKLSWFAGVALKLFTAIASISDDLQAKTVTIGSGSVMLLGPGDFACCSPYAVPITTTSNDNEVKCLRSFSFERVSLHRVLVTIVPSVDLGTRGGMYAALLIAVDSSDFQLLAQENNAKNMMEKYSPNYDDIIRHPRAKLGPVTKSLTLSISPKPTPHNVRVEWNNDTGFVNAYPSCVLIVAFSDLAAKVDDVDAGYTPAKSLFEVHLKGDVLFHEPADLVVQHNVNRPSMSNYTQKILTTNCQSINAVTKTKSRSLVHFGRCYDYVEPFSFDQLPVDAAIDVMQFHNISENIQRQYKASRNENVDDFDMCKI